MSAGINFRSNHSSHSLVNDDFLFFVWLICWYAKIQTVVKYVRQNRPRPICERLAEEGDCTDRNCFFNHLPPTPEFVDILVQVPRSHASRVMEYLRANKDTFSPEYRMDIKEGYGLASKGKIVRGAHLNHFLYITLEREIEKRAEEPCSLSPPPEQSSIPTPSTSSSSSSSSSLSSSPPAELSGKISRSKVAMRIREDRVLERAVARVYVADRCCHSLKDSVKEIRETLRKMHKETFGDTDPIEAVDKLHCRFMAFPRSLETDLSQAVKDMVTPSVIVRDAVVTLVVTERRNFLFSVSRLRADDKVDSPENWARLLKHEPPVISVGPSRAGMKLQELFMREGVVLGEGARGIDVGASPGGWSYFLSTHCVAVIAVDPGELASPVPVNVKHIRKLVQDVDLRKEGPFDILCSDMNVPPQELLDITLRSLPEDMWPEVVVLTMKCLKGKGSEGKSFHCLIEERVCVPLRQRYVTVALVHLMSNREREMTVLARGLKKDVNKPSAQPSS